MLQSAVALVDRRHDDGDHLPLHTRQIRRTAHQCIIEIIVCDRTRGIEAATARDLVDFAIGPSKTIVEPPKFGGALFDFNISNKRHVGIAVPEVPNSTGCDGWCLSQAPVEGPVDWCTVGRGLLWPIASRDPCMRMPDARPRRQGRPKGSPERRGTSGLRTVQIWRFTRAVTGVYT